MRQNSYVASRRSFLRGSGALLGASALWGLTGCSQDTVQQGRTTSGRYSGQAAATHLSSVVGNAPLIVAQETGLFSDQKLDLELATFPGSSDVIRGIMTGIPLALAAPLAVAAAYDQGSTKLRLVGGGFNGSQIVFIAKADSPIQSIDDLKGKKIGVASPGGVVEYFGLKLAELGGVDKKSVVAVGAPPDSWTAVSQGVVDVSYCPPPLATQLIESGDAKLIYHTRDLANPWTDLSLVATTDIIESDPAGVEAYVRAYAAACKLITDDIDTAAAAYAKGAKLDKAVAMAALQGEPPSAFSAKFDIPGVEAAIEAGIEVGSIKKGFSLDKILVRDFDAAQ